MNHNKLRASIVREQGQRMQKKEDWRERAAAVASSGHWVAIDPAQVKTLTAYEIRYVTYIASNTSGPDFTGVITGI